MYCSWPTYWVTDYPGQPHTGAKGAPDYCREAVLRICASLAEGVHETEGQVAQRIIDALQATGEIDKVADDLWDDLVSMTTALEAPSAALVQARTAMSNAERSLLTMAFWRMKRDIQAFGGWSRVDYRESREEESSDTSSVGRLERVRPGGEPSASAVIAPAIAATSKATTKSDKRPRSTAAKSRAAPVIAVARASSASGSTVVAERPRVRRRVDAELSTDM